ncbi:hypothetical protein JCM10207_007610 [Rhodosporidiobolus poonsookiae]
MHVATALLPLAFASGALAAAISTRSSSSCHDLWEAAPKILPSLEVYWADRYTNGNFSDPEYQSVAYPAAVPDLPDFCRFGAWIHTSNRTKVQFEVWLPDDWSGRFAMVGNGGDAGGVNFPDMGMPMAKYKFAVASTDTGHHGTSGDGTFAAGNPESQIDFGYRAVHLTTVYSKKVIEAYYGKKQDKSYWIGCSSGGKQGLKEVQAYPEDYDGVIAGAAAQKWQRLNAQTWRINAIVNPPTSEGFLNASDYNTIGIEVLKQCDAADGLEDGIILNPRRCKPDLSTLLCDQPGANASTCLTQPKIDTMNTIYANYTFLNGTYLFASFEPGSEGIGAGKTFSVTGTPYGPGPDFYNFQVLNNTNTSIPFNVTDEGEFEKLVQVALDTDPGKTNADEPNIEPFFKRGGKLWTYVGLADTLIPTGSTLLYYEQVREALGYPDDLGDHYRMFTIPGMGHCRGGAAAYNFGGPGQRPEILGGLGQSTKFDEEHDMILAMIDWVENGNAPDVLIGSKFVGDDIRNGTAYQRKFCPYPQEGVYTGGDPNSADSFECRYQG